MGNYIPRPYQEVAVRDIIQHLNTKNPKPGLVVIPTGGGKSLVIADLIDKMGSPATLVLQPTRELLKQNYSKFTGPQIGGKASIYSASMNTKEVGNVTYATPMSLKGKAELFQHVELVLFDECFPYKTPISTLDGSKYIGDIHEELKTGKEVLVKTFNEVTQTFEYKKVLRSKNNGSRELLKIGLGAASFSTTNNHKVLTTKGWCRADELNKGDAVITSHSSEKIHSYAQLNEDQFDLMIGTSLGDGFLEFRNKDHTLGRIKMIQGAKQEEYLRFKAEILSYNSNVNFVDKNGYSGTPAFVVQGPVVYLGNNFSNYEKQIDNLTPKSLAILWQDDGSLSKFQNSGSLYALCHSESLVRRLKDKIEKLGVRDTVVDLTKSSSTGKDVYYIRFRKKSVQDISKIVCKYVNKNLSYKITDEYKHLVGTYEWSNKYKPSVKLVTSVQKTNRFEEVFDIEVEDNHNFIVVSKTAHRHLNSEWGKNRGYTNDGVVVHNCHIGTTPRKSGKRINRGQVYRFLSKLPKTVKVVGFTATPITLQVKGNRFDNYHQLSILTRITPRFWSKIIHVTQMKELYDNKYLSPLRFTSFDRGMRNAKSRGSDFDMEDVRLINQRSDVTPFTADLINESIKRGKKKILVFTPTVEEAYELQKLVPSEVVASGTKSEERENIIESFVEGDLKVLTNFGTLSVGFDCPEIDLIICMRPTKSYALWYQIVGRGIRIAEGKDLCDVVDLSGNYLEFGDPKDLEIRDDQSTKGWAMFVKNKVITGVPIHQEGKKELQKSSPILKNIITFGKHKGRKWVDVPDSYSRFLADKGDLNTKWAEENIKPYLRALGLIE